MADIIAALATGKGPCAIGILRLSGANCAAVVQRVFQLQNGGRVAAAEPRKLQLGTLLDAKGRVIDQALLCYSPAPHSYTGEDTAELHCHGSPAVLAAGLEALFAAGARQALAGEFTKRAFLNGRLDLIGAEAVADLIDAQTADAAANAAGQLCGTISRRLQPIYESLTDICSHYHAVLDYPDEDLPAFQLSGFEKSLLVASAELGKLLSTFARGRFLREGVRVALLGRPNVGKSSLLNALAGFDRAIVTTIPGTTRDTVEQTVRFGKVLAALTDTAGIRRTDDEIEQLGVQRALAAAREADLAVFVCDGSQPLTDDDRQAIAAVTAAPQKLAVINKSDLPQQVFRLQLPFETILPVSAKTGDGLDALGSFIERSFRNELPCDGSILTNVRQADATQRAKQSIDSALHAMARSVTPDAVLTDVEQALQSLGELTGRTVREDITAKIFERFCVGK